jgi:5-formyltetrahydrofolate cyclo-ligase
MNTGYSDKVGDKAAARKAAFVARRRIFDSGLDSAACDNLLSLLADAPPTSIVSAYMPIRTEISPLPVMAALVARGLKVCVPVIRSAGQPLVFSLWTPEAEMVEGPFGARIPAVEELLTPDILITPLLAYDARGYRLGYGGGFYDRTFEALKAQGHAIGIGFAYSAQELAEVPTEPTDQRLDVIVTETGTTRLSPLPFG